MGDVAPDLLDPVVGWRVWDVVELDASLRLCSLAFWSVWLPGRHAQAVCRRALVDRRAGLPEHDAPDERCTCGIYATETARAALGYSRRFPRRRDTVHRVLGRVALWGTVVECSGGWRAERGYPSSLVVNAWPGRRGLRGRLGPQPLPGESVALGLEDYRVPVELVHARSDAALVQLLEPESRRP